MATLTDNENAVHETRYRHIQWLESKVGRKIMSTESYSKYSTDLLGRHQHLVPVFYRSVFIFENVYQGNQYNEQGKRMYERSVVSARMGKGIIDWEANHCIGEVYKLTFQGSYTINGYRMHNTLGRATEEALMRDLIRHL